MSDLSSSNVIFSLVALNWSTVKRFCSWSRRIFSSTVSLQTRRRTRIFQMLVNDSKWTKRLFVLIAAMNTFFIPLLFGYYYNHKKAINATKQMEKNKNEIMNLLNKNFSEYQEILKDIQERKTT